MNVDDLWDRISERLDQQDEERRALASTVEGMRSDIGGLSREMGEVKTSVSKNGDACKARHESSERKIGIIRGILITIGLGTAATAAATLWARVIPDK